MPGKDLGRCLGKLDSCLLSDTLEKLGIEGVVTGLQPVAFRRRIAGPVVTVALAPSTGEIKSGQVHLAVSALEVAPRGAVVVVANDGRTEAAAWGGLLSTAARRMGLVGAIIDGACRDVDDARRLGFPVYARAVSPRTARGRYVEISHNKPVLVGGIRVSPGDFVLADSTGVVFISAQVAERVLRAAMRLRQREDTIRAAIRRKAQIKEALGIRYERLVRRNSE